MADPGSRGGHPDVDQPSLLEEGGFFFVTIMFLPRITLSVHSFILVETGQNAFHVSSWILCCKTWAEGVTFRSMKRTSCSKTKISRLRIEAHWSSKACNLCREKL